MKQFFLKLSSLVIILLIISRSIFAAEHAKYKYKYLPDDAKYVILERLLDTAQSLDEVYQLATEFWYKTGERAFSTSPEVQELVARRQREFIQESLDKTLGWTEANPARIDIVRGGINAHGARGNTVLTYLASGDEHFHPEYIPLFVTLINYGADINAANNLSRTPLMLATLNHNITIMNILLQNRNIHMNLQDAYGKTALMLATTIPPVDTPTPFEILLSHDARFTIRDNEGNTVLKQLTVSNIWYANFYADILFKLLEKRGINPRFLLE